MSDTLPLNDADLDTLIGVVARDMLATTPADADLSTASLRALNLANFCEAHKLQPKGPSLLFVHPGSGRATCHPVEGLLRVGRRSLAEDAERGSDLVIHMPSPLETGNFGRRQFTITHGPEGTFVAQDSESVPTFHNEDNEGIVPGKPRRLLDGDCLFAVGVLFYFTLGSQSV